MSEWNIATFIILLLKITTYADGQEKQDCPKIIDGDQCSIQYLINTLNSNPNPFAQMILCEYANTESDCLQISSNTCIWDDNKCEVSSLLLQTRIGQCIQSQSCIDYMHAFSDSDLYSRSQSCTLNDFDPSATENNEFCNVVQRSLQCYNFPLNLQECERIDVEQPQLVQGMADLMGLQVYKGYDFVCTSVIPQNRESCAFTEALKKEYLEQFLTLQNGTLLYVNQCKSWYNDDACEIIEVQRNHGNGDETVQLKDQNDSTIITKSNFKSGVDSYTNQELYENSSQILTPILETIADLGYENEQSDLLNYDVNLLNSTTESEYAINTIDTYSNTSIDQNNITESLLKDFSNAFSSLESQQSDDDSGDGDNSGSVYIDNTGLIAIIVVVLVLMGVCIITSYICYCRSRHRQSSQQDQFTQNQDHVQQDLELGVQPQTQQNEGDDVQKQDGYVPPLLLGNQEQQQLEKYQQRYLEFISGEGILIKKQLSAIEEGIEEEESAADNQLIDEEIDNELLAQKSENSLSESSENDIQVFKSSEEGKKVENGDGDEEDSLSEESFKSSSGDLP